MTEDDRFQRWQKLTIEQLGKAVNLFLTFAVAALGFTFATLKEPYIQNASANVKILVIICLALLGLSTLFGLLCTLNRLRDFRATAQRARNSPNAASKEDVAGLGKTTWGLFYIQTLAFLGGITLLAVALVAVM